MILNKPDNKKTGGSIPVIYLKSIDVSCHLPSCANRNGTRKIYHNLWQLNRHYVKFHKTDYEISEYKKTLAQLESLISRRVIRT